MGILIIICIKILDYIYYSINAPKFASFLLSLRFFHHSSSIRHAHQILVLDNGSIMERGTHDELVSIHNGLYSKLWNMQLKERLVTTGKSEEGEEII